MSEPVSVAGGGSSAGTLLRLARERQGLHVAALAAAIKIPQRKLEALEADRFDELPDTTFTRALAITVCRALKIDSAPVLAQLPEGGPRGLAKVSGSLNTPFHQKSGRSESAESGAMKHPLTWAALLVLVVAAVLYLLPQSWWPSWSSGSTKTTAPVAVPLPEPAASAASEVASVADAAASAAETAASDATTVEVVQSAPLSEPAANAETAAAADVAVLSATGASWVEVIDADGQVLVQRVLRPGESLDLNGRLPLKFKIGNAAATQLQFRGQSVDLGPVTRDNVARLELK